MKYEIFISYSDFDKEKVNLIVKELEGHPTFQHLVISFQREALKPLAKKVSEGIIRSEVIVPILTSKSITTQWINQEIGFAEAKEKRIRPLVQSNLIDKLKGFIHKQIDLPYNYDVNDNSEIENANFLAAFKMLLSDLEKEFLNVSSQNPAPVKSEFEESLEHADHLMNELEFKNQRNEFLHSQEAVISAREHVLKMFNEFKDKLLILKNKGINFGTEMDENELKFAFKGNKLSCSIVWSQPYYDYLTDATLNIKLWKGYISIKKDTFYFPSEQPQQFSFNTYTFDRDKNLHFVWHQLEDETNYTSEQIINKCIKALVDIVAQKRMTELND